LEISRRRRDWILDIQVMNNPIKRILLLYADTYYLVNQVYPFGLDIIANHLRRNGYSVFVDYPFLEHPDPKANLERIIAKSRPDLVGIGIRNLDTAFSQEPFGDYDGPDYRTFYFLPHIENVVVIIKNILPQTPIMLGGGAFSIAPVPIMKKLEVEYGIVGEGEAALLQFVDAFPDQEKMKAIENLVFRHGGTYHINPKQVYGFAGHSEIFTREETFNYAYETTGMPIRTKRGCNQTCSYCVEPVIEGRKFIYKSHETIIQELEFIAKTYHQVRKLFIADAELNVPDLEHSRSLIKKIIAGGFHERFRFSSQFLPKPFDAEFAELLARAGFSVVLTCDSFADDVLKKNLAPFCEKDIENTLALCARFGLECTVCLIFGLPGETYETMEYTLQKMHQYPLNELRRYEYTMGGRIYQGTPLSRIAIKETRHLYGQKSDGYLEPFYYCAPESPQKLKNHVGDNLPFGMDYKCMQSEASRQVLGTAYLVDQKRWAAAADWFLKIDLSSKSASYDYLFRNLSNAGEINTAKNISDRFLSHIVESGNQNQYGEQIQLIRFYTSLLS
jgi:hypothetical protein